MTEQTNRQTIWGIVRTAFGRGIVILVPVVITVWVLNILFTIIDGIISPILDRVLGRHIVGAGFVSMIILILLVGVLSRNLIGHTLFKYFERLFTVLPLARTIYSAMKDIIRAFQLGSKGKSFRQVVLVEYPRTGLFTIGFVTNEIKIKRDEISTDMVSIYLPHPPNPTSGVLILVHKKDLHVLDISIEDGLKLLLSGGIVTSGLLSLRKS